MALNTIENFNIEGNRLVELLELITNLQELRRASTEVKIMLADNTDNLEEAVADIYALPAYTTDPETTLAASYPISAYRLTTAQVPERASVNQIRSIRPFININA